MNPERSRLWASQDVVTSEWDGMGCHRASSRLNMEEPRFRLAHKGVLTIPSSDPAKSSFFVDLVLSQRPSGAVMIETVPRGWQGSLGTGPPMA